MGRMRRQAAVFLILLLALTACAGKETVSFSGRIEEANENSVLIAVSGQSDFDKASVFFTDETDFLTEDEAPFDPSGLEAGMEVTVVFDGTVRESYPVQIQAKRIVVVNEGQ